MNTPPGGRRRGFVLGKFMPPHAGHVHLCQFAQNLCDRLTILVCSLDSEPIPGELRHQWMTQLFPKARVLHCAEDLPQDPSDHPDFWAIWRGVVQRFHPEPVDRVFASESYGQRLAQEVGAAFWPCDLDREAFNISATAIRAHPKTHWSLIANPARAWFTRTVVLHGPESTGKSTLGQRLAQRYAGVFVPEFGRTYCELFGTDCSAQDLLNIAEGQDAAIDAAGRQSAGLIFSDTDAVLTEVWSEMMLGETAFQTKPPRVSGDLYLLTDVDQPWVDDGTRIYGDDDARRRFFKLSEAALKRYGVDYVHLKGGWDQREAVARQAIEARFASLLT